MIAILVNPRRIVCRGSLIEQTKLELQAIRRHWAGPGRGAAIAYEERRNCRDAFLPHESSYSAERTTSLFNWRDSSLVKMPRKYFGAHGRANSSLRSCGLVPVNSTR